MESTVEIWKEGGIYHAYIGSDGASGYECAGRTKAECAKQIASYFEDAFFDIDE